MPDKHGRIHRKGRGTAPEISDKGDNNANILSTFKPKISHKPPALSAPSIS